MIVLALVLTTASAQAVNASSPGIMVTPTSGLETTEAGATSQFSMVLNTEPSADVTIALSSSDTTEGTVSPTSVTFTADSTEYITRNPSLEGDVWGEWDNSYIAVDEGPSYNDSDFILGIATDPPFTGSASRLFGFTSFDIPEGVTINSLTIHYRAGDDIIDLLGNNIYSVIRVNGYYYYGGDQDPSASFSWYSDTWDRNPYTWAPWTREEINGVALAAELQQFGVGSTDLTPDVRVSVIYAEVSYSVPGNWDVPQTATVTGVNDDDNDGNILYSIVTAPAASADSNYNGLNVPNVSVTNLDSPMAYAQSVTTAEDTEVDIMLIGSDENGDPLNYTVHRVPYNGSLSGIAPSLTYTPRRDYFGPDSFTFTVNDGTADSAAATVSITINPVNDVPVAYSQSKTTDEDTPISIALRGNDVDHDPLTYTVHDGPFHGGLTGSAPDLIYTPEAGYNGTDSFTFTVNDGTMDSAYATVSITIRPPGITVTPTSGLETTEAGATSQFSMVLDTKPAADVTIALSSADITEGTVSPTSLTFLVDSMEYMTRNPSLEGDVWGEWANSYTAIDEGWVYNDNDYILGIATDPTFTGYAHRLFKFNNFDIPEGVTINSLTIHYRAGDDIVDLFGNNIYSVIRVNDYYYYGGDQDPSASFSWYSDTWERNPYTWAPWTREEINGVWDPGLQQFGVGSTDLTPDVRVSVIYAEVSYSVPGNWDVPQTATVTGVNDDDNDGNILYSIVTAPAASADSNYNSLNAPDVSVTNLDDEEVINMAPTITSDGGGDTASVEVAENAVAVTTVAAIDPDASATLAFSISGGVDSVNFGIDSATGVLTFLSAPNFEAPVDDNGDNVYEVFVQVSDGAVPIPLTDNQAISVSVIDINDVPVAVSESYTIDENGFLDIAAPGILDNDSDPDGDSLIAIKITDPSHGTLGLNIDGSFNYTPDANFNGGDDFTYKAKDIHNTESAPATVSITVNAVNDPPALADGIVSPTTGYVSTTFTYSVTYTDADNDPPASPTVSIDGGLAKDMLVRAGEDGDYTNGEIYEYTVTGAELGLGSHTFQFAASDGIADAAGDTGSHSGPAISSPIQSFKTFVVKTMTINWARDVKKGKKDSDKFIIWGRLQLPQGCDISQLKKQASVSIKISTATGTDTVVLKNYPLGRLGNMWKYRGSGQPPGDGLTITNLNIWWSPSGKWSGWAGFSVSGVLRLPAGIGVNTQPAEATVTFNIPVITAAGGGSLEGKAQVTFKVNQKLNLWSYVPWFKLPDFPFDPAD